MRPRFGLITGVLLTITCLWLVDAFLARTERREVQSEARHDAGQGERLLASGHPLEAVDALRKAVALDRDNANYALELAEAFIGADKLDEAATTLSEVLEESPNDGRANLLEARLMVRRGKPQEAEAYYHRAIYGIWSQNSPEDSKMQRIRVRLELADLLASHKSNEELLAELIPLEAEAQNDAAVSRQVAQLYIKAGAPDRAVTVYRALLRDNPDDGQNCAGLGEADLALGNYRDAQAAFQLAIKHGADTQARVDLATRLLNLDPTLRNLSTAAKFDRSTAILRLARDTLARCATTPAAQKLLDDANSALTAKIHGPPANEMAEDRLAMAQTLWEYRSNACPITSDDEMLSLIMKKLSE